MKHIYLLTLATVAIFLCSCSSYHEDLVYSKKINTSPAISTSSQKVVSVVQIPSEHTKVAIETNSTGNIIVKQDQSFAKKLLATAPVKKANKLINKIVSASPVQLITGHSNSVIASRQDALHTQASIHNNGLFLLMLSMFVMLVGAIIIFSGFSTAQTIIAIAGFVVLIAGVILFAVSAAKIVARSGQ
jgi:hypothetical protein